MILDFKPDRLALLKTAHTYKTRLYIPNSLHRLVDVLRDFGRSDWQLASMVCQTFWNYSGRITSANACFGENEANDLLELLLEYLGT